jgi:uncharacterized membrane protein
MSLRHSALKILAAMPLLVAIHLAVYYPQLPNSVASHFGPNGRADAWMPKSAFAFVYVGLITFMTLLLLGVGTLMRALPPEMINLPNKVYWLAPERREQTAARFAQEIAAFGIALNLFLITTMQMTFQATLSGTNALNMPVFLLIFAGFMTFVIAWLIHLFRGYALPS